MGTDQETVEKPAEKALETKSDSIRQEYTFASDVKLKECKYCRVMIPKKAKICPNCKMVLKNHTFLKAVASILVIALIAVGGYCLSAYWGLLPDCAVPVWIAQSRTETPVTVVSMTTVEPTETAAGAKTVEPTEVATATEITDTVVAAETKEAMLDQESADSEEVKEETKSTPESDRAKGEDVVEDKVAAEDKSSVEDRNDSEKKDTEEDKSGSEDESEDNRPVVNAKDIDEKEAAFRADCEPRKYKSLLRDEEYLDTAVLVTEAEVVCLVDGGLFDENVYYLCREKVNDIDCYYIIRDDREEDATLILEGDIITVYGQLFGTCKIPATLIETRPVVPAISMVSFDLLEE